VSEPRPPLNKRCHVCGYRYESTVTECPFDHVPLAKPRPGVEHLGPYRLVERLAAGGMGAVYRALHEKVGRAVAVKLLHHSLRNEVVGVSRFFHEARAVNTIRHPNVVEVYDLSGEGEDVYMVLELLQGQDLRTMLGQQTRGCLPPARAVHILEQVCGALQATHARKIVHRDLKPENVFLCTHTGRKDFVKLLDFGVAKLERPEGRLTREGIALGTPEYMAPEQARGADVDGRTDLYAVGCIAFEMLTGRTVFQGAAPGDVMMKHVRTPPPSPRDFNPSVPTALEAVVLRCLAKSPKARPQSALELAQELCAAVGQPFDETGAFSGWRTWDKPENSSINDMPALEVKAPRRTLYRTVLRPVMKTLRRRRQAVVVGAVSLALALGVWLVASGSRQSAVATASAQPATAAGSEAATGPAELVVQSSPLAAQIFDESGALLGVTPHRLSLARGTSMKLRLQRPGYRPAERVIQADSVERTILVPLEAEVPARGKKRPDRKRR
jgi:serine/threonine-protein kinase